MADTNEYPRLVYKDGGEHEVWGKKVQILEVADADELQTALADGWAKRPDGLNEEPAEDAEPKAARAKKPAEVKPTEPPAPEAPAA